jgi:pilus assembly protein CpaE
MNGNLALQSEDEIMLACTITRDVQDFDLLIEDMETELGEAWGDIELKDALIFLDQDNSKHLEFIALVIDKFDVDNVAYLCDVIRAAAARNLDVILIADDVSPIVLHQLLQLGAKEFVPYPLPEGALHEAINRLRNTLVDADIAPTPAQEETSHLSKSGTKDAVIFATQSLAGGTGATTLAVNLAWELTQINKTKKRKNGTGTAPKVMWFLNSYLTPK